MLIDCQTDFSHFFKANPDQLHFTAHSHHPWPDVSFEAQKQYWLDSISLTDRKWEQVFDETIPEAQSHIARVLNLSNPSTITFAPNTHEFVVRLLSCLPIDRPPKILTTDSEFHSFNRQTKRLEEEGLIEVSRITTAPYESFEERFINTIKSDTYDLVFFSHVFFTSGFVVPDLKAIVDAVTNSNCLVAIDGYHGFMALSTDLSQIQNRVFYLAGGYKYAMAGEGACFMHCPPGIEPRPRNTGWFAAMGALEQPVDQIAYAENGSRFAGATFDVSGLYRFNAVQNWLQSNSISVADIHEHSIELQQGLLLATGWSPLAKGANFLSFERGNAEEIQKKLLDQNIITDLRGSNIRFGFSIYQDKQMLKQLIQALL